MHLGAPSQGAPSGRGRREARHTAGTPLPAASPLVKGRKNTDDAINLSFLLETGDKRIDGYLQKWDTLLNLLCFSDAHSDDLRESVECCQVSVPVRGIGLKVGRICVSIRSIMFPSPLGELD